MSDGLHNNNSYDTDERTSDVHPMERASDRGLIAFFWQHKLYRDLILVIGAFIIWQGFAAIQDGRRTAVLNSCNTFNDAVASVNSLSHVTQGLILSGAALPGDTPGPVDKQNQIDPTKWKTLAPGPLSRQLAKQYPDFPTSQERLENAQSNAQKLEDTHVKPRDCKAEAAAVKGGS